VIRERVSEQIYVFTSELYAQVTAGVIVTKGGTVLVDTLPFPPESRQMASFARKVRKAGVQYVILTHYHSDHINGAYLFPDADVVAHARCRELIEEVGAKALEEAKGVEPTLEEVSIRLPDITFDDEEMSLQVGGRPIRLIHAPGHTEDSIMVYVEDDRVLFTSDLAMPVPSIADGDIDAFRSSLKKIPELSIENIVQGHGEVILRGEVDEVVERSLNYLDCVEATVEEAVEEGKGREFLEAHSIEECGLSRIPLNGMVQQIHTANLLTIYDLKVSG